MSLDKAIQHGKEHREGYRARGLPGECDKTCRPHGGGTSIPCAYCERNRLIGLRRLVQRANDEMREFHRTRDLDERQG